jgi:predicted dehydrogenase
VVGVAIIGCGAVGHKRAKALGSARLIACADVVAERAHALATAARASQGEDVRLATSDWRAALAHPDVSVVIVSTTNNALSEVSLAAIYANRHVLVEKPAARNRHELKPMIEAACKAGVQVRVGFNHRYHPALLKARELLDLGVLGELMFVRGRYGHGGRIGYDREWRARPELSGGGELMDQGVHLIDLARWFLGDFNAATGFAHTYFWDMPVDDNAFMLLKTPRQQTAFLHVSCTEWKNMFSFEVYGKKAKLHVEGLGGSYGVERLYFYRMLPQMGPPETTIWEYPAGAQDDVSWRLEFDAFLEDIRLGRTPSANLLDADAALAVVETIYGNS